MNSDNWLTFLSWAPLAIPVYLVIGYVVLSRSGIRPSETGREGLLWWPLLLFFHWFDRWYNGHGRPSVRTHLVGRQGVAVTALAPLGQVEIDDQPYQARAEDETTVAAGMTVEVQAANSNWLVVRAIDHPPA